MITNADKDGFVSLITILSASSALPDHGTSPAELNERGLLLPKEEVIAAFKEAMPQNVTLRNVLGVAIGAVSLMLEKDPNLSDEQRETLHYTLMTLAFASQINETRTISEPSEDDSSRIEVNVALSEVIERVNTFIQEPEKVTVMLYPAITMLKGHSDLGKVHPVANLAAIALALRHQIYDSPDSRRKDTLETLMLLGAALYGNLSEQDKEYFAEHITRIEEERPVVVEFTDEAGTKTGEEANATSLTFEQILANKLR